MHKTRVIPVLLLGARGLEKGVGFRDRVYVGCPRNAARVFNAHRVDELVLVDIVATPNCRPTRVDYVQEIARETTMPFAAGGGVRSLDDMRRLLEAGADRVVLNTAAVENPCLIESGASRFGSQCMLVSIDALRHPDGRYEVFTACGTRPAGIDPVEAARIAEAAGAGELLVTAIHRDGTMSGYDVDLVRRVVDAVNIPVIAGGGAGSVEHIAEVVLRGGAAAAACGAFVVFYGKRRTVLITYPSVRDLRAVLPEERVRNRDLVPPPDMTAVRL
ncbi:MAG TPA: HisA/HisF-related TIM barrel protein [Candidatus Hydrogenedentes bacterium]|nr:HisA/HisF-related TIM barrel protein [Candidatus Hydrogenedentota bacterium]